MVGMVPPIKVGDKVKAKVIGKGSSGDPFIKVDNFIVFLKDQADVDSDVEVEIEKVTSRVGFAKLVKNE